MTGRREQDTRQPHGGSSRRRGGVASDSGFESLDSEGYYRSPPANHATPLFTDVEQDIQWNSLPNLQQAYRDLWDKLDVATRKDRGMASEISKLTGDLKKADEKCHKLNQKLDDADRTNASLKRENDEFRKDKSALKRDNDELRREIAHLQQDKAQASQDLAHIKAQRDRYKNELEDARSTSSESTSSKHKRTMSSSAAKVEKPRDKEREGRDRERERERERDRDRAEKKERSPKERKDREVATRERDPMDSGVGHLRERFDPSRTQQQAQQQQPQQIAVRPQSRRMSTTIRPQVHVATAYDGNYIPTTMGITPPTAYSVPRGGHPSVAVPTYPTAYTSDGNYHPAPLPQNTQK
ncbi:hypothetical protein RB601_003826 [Gaeumannomyces tritici]